MKKHVVEKRTLFFSDLVIITPAKNEKYISNVKTFLSRECGDDNSCSTQTKLQRSVVIALLSMWVERILYV
jgi:hypothetical protein